MKTASIIALLIIILTFAIGIYFYPLMPDKLASHWSAQGQVNSYMPKFWGLFLMPLISVVLLALFLLIPKTDPLKENIAKFRKYFDGFIILLFLFLFYIYLLSIFWNLNLKYNMIQALMPAFAVLFYYMGILISNAKRNWFIGIRTPWTLSSEAVWDKTHQLGGKMFKASAIIALLGMFFQQAAIFFVLIPIIFTAIYTIVFSYFQYQKEVKK
jgi:uncharacterized membrane protein